ncbi:plasminogen receptor (KT), partial [Salmonella sp. s54925]|uniref:plasminogen receptor (KT) n=1 Tax=Salmonella sp. s54925 TaxID=3159674 RepID=UPI003980CDF4
FSREMFLWWGSFYAVASFGAVMGFLKTKKPVFLGPLVPLTFIVGYQADLAYGTKLTRIRDEAENIMKNEANLLDLPLGTPTIELIDEKRKTKS